MSHLSISATEPSSLIQKSKKRQRLTIEGINVREDFRKSLSGRPASLTERKQFVANIQKLPGCEWYGIVNLNQYLKSHADHETVETNFGTISAKRFATLTPQVREHLSTLLTMEETPPTDSKVKLWAGMVQATGASETDVVDWVIWQQLQMRKQRREQDASKSDRLPTPAHTASPEPPPAVLKSPASPVSPMPSVGSPVFAWSGPHSYYNRDAAQQSPVIVSAPASASISRTQPQQEEASPSRRTSVSLQASKRDRSESMSISRATSPTGMSPRPGYSLISAKSKLSTPRAQSQRPPSPTPERHAPTLRELIMQGVAEAKTMTISPQGQLPRSPVEFNALFASYENRFSHLIQALEP